MAQWKGSMSCVRGSQVLIPLWPTRTDPAWESPSLAIAYRDVVAWWYVLFLVTRGSQIRLYLKLLRIQQPCTSCSSTYYCPVNVMGAPRPPAPPPPKPLPFLTSFFP